MNMQHLANMLIGFRVPQGTQTSLIAWGALKKCSALRTEGIISNSYNEHWRLPSLIYDVVQMCRNFLVAFCFQLPCRCDSTWIPVDRSQSFCPDHVTGIKGGSFCFPVPWKLMLFGRQNQFYLSTILHVHISHDILKNEMPQSSYIIKIPRDYSVCGSVRHH
jgi:hypothetical protein